MPAVITDQFRISNAETFVQSFVGVGTTANYYYTFLAHQIRNDFTMKLKITELVIGIRLLLVLKTLLSKNIHTTIVCYS